MTKVSIITVSYNSAATIARTIEGVLNQTYKNIEYIIVDGASKDETVDIIKKYEGSFEGRLHWVSEPDNGIYYAMNKGIEMATGDLIGIINSDDWYEPDAVSIMVDQMEKDHSNPRTVYHGITAFIVDGQVRSMVKLVSENLENAMSSHPACFVTAACYKEMGVFNTKYVSVADFDLMLRYYRSGKVKFVSVDEHIANSVAGGMSSTTRAYIDLLHMKADYGKITKTQEFIEVSKAKIADGFKKMGLKPITLRRKNGN